MYEPPPNPPEPSAGGAGSVPTMVTVSAPAPLTPSPGPYRPRVTHLPSYLLSRFLAFVIDVFGVAFVLAIFGVHFTQAGIVTLPIEAGNFWLLATAAFSLALIIAFVCEGLFATTLGKLLFGLVVRNSNGGFAGLGRALTRTAFRPLDLVLIGPLFVLVTPKRQRIGDLVAGTVVSQTRFAPVMTFIAAIVMAGIGYAVIVWGGGVTSAIAVAAQSLATGSDLASKLKAAQPNLPVVSPSPVENAVSPPPQMQTSAPVPESGPESPLPVQTT